MPLNLTADYLQMRNLIEDATNNFLNLVAYPSLRDLIYDKSFSVVYSYKATQRAMRTRRYEIGDKEALSAWVGGGTLIITNTTTLQHNDGTYETDIVQEGYSSYRQPYPRPFMEEALNEYVDSGRADEEYAQCLQEAGFEVRRI